MLDRETSDIRVSAGPTSAVRCGTTSTQLPNWGLRRFKSCRAFERRGPPDGDNVTMKAGPGTRKSCGSTTDGATQCPAVPELSRYSSAPIVYQRLVSRQRGGSTSVSLCDLVSLGTDESDPPRGTENPRRGSPGGSCRPDLLAQHVRMLSRRPPASEAGGTPKMVGWPARWHT